MIGRLVSQEVLCIGVGITAAYWIDFGMSYTQGSIAWRLPISLQLILAMSVVILLFGLPESPRWLCKRGREDEAIDVLCKVFDLPPEDEYIQVEMRNIRHAIEIETAAGAQSLANLFKSDRLKTRRRVILAYIGLFMNQLSGINLVVYYMPTVLVTNVGMGATQAQLIAGFIELMFIVGSLLPSLALDRMGRRWTMIWGGKKCQDAIFRLRTNPILLSVRSRYQHDDDHYSPQLWTEGDFLCRHCVLLPLHAYFRRFVGKMCLLALT